MTNKKFSIKDDMPELIEAMNLVIQRAEERRLAEENVWSKFNEITDDIIASSQRRQARLRKENS
jgi:hypothetical protein